MSQGIEGIGKCILCGVVGQGEKDFICKLCGSPEKVMVCCSDCGARVDITKMDPEQRKSYLSFYFSDEELGGLGAIQEVLQGLPGFTIFVSMCQSCVNSERVPSRKPQIYKIRYPQIHDSAADNKRKRLGH
ncbi:MAG TPA: hypothetical protein P5089_02225 [Candidatus Portnoybacteria bacterium]|nr:hypothetical protein [Candidatus Portnoybacteria bacterium]